MELSIDRDGHGITVETIDVNIEIYFSIVCSSKFSVQTRRTKLINVWLLAIEALKKTFVFICKFARFCNSFVGFRKFVPRYCFEQNRKFETKINADSSALWARCTVPCCNEPVVLDVVWGGSKGKFATNAIATPPLYPSPPPPPTYPSPSPCGWLTAANFAPTIRSSSVAELSPCRYADRSRILSSHAAFAFKNTPYISVIFRRRNELLHDKSEYWKRLTDGMGGGGITRRRIDSKTTRLCSGRKYVDFQRKRIASIDGRRRLYSPRHGCQL